MGFNTSEIRTWAETNATIHPREILSFALENYSPRVGISFSGAEDVALVDMAVKLGGDFQVFSLDTGRLHPETYQCLEAETSGKLLTKRSSRHRILQSLA